MAKRKKIITTGLYLNTKLLEIHNGTCKKVMTRPDNYEYLGQSNETFKYSERINDLVGIDLAKQIRKCSKCYK